jgi:hypothetical protein
MRTCISEFRQLHRFLFDVVTRLAEKGHDSMQDLAIRLDFNAFYHHHHTQGDK